MPIPLSSASPTAKPEAARRPVVGTVGRERLLARLTAARHLRCIAVTGPAGAGKSALIAAWRRALVPMGFEVA